VSLPGPVEEARALAGSSRAEVLQRLGTSEDAVARGVEYGQRSGLDEVETDTGRVVFDGDRVAVVFLRGHAAGTSPDELMAELGGEGETLPGANTAGSEVHVYADEGLAFSADGPKLEMVEAFPPTTLERYRETLYRNPPRFII
jgi:hypothetical protein